MRGSMTRGSNGTIADGLPAARRRSQARSTPARRSRRSMTAPSYRSAERISPVEADHAPSVTSRPLAPSVGLPLELRDERDLAPVPAATVDPVPAEASAVPAIAQSRDDDVACRPQERGDVVGVGEEPLVVRRPARREQLVADRLAVQPHVVEAERGHVQARAADGRRRRRTRGGATGLGACRSRPGSFGQRDRDRRPSRPRSRRPASTRSTGLHAVQPSPVRMRTR